MNLSQRAGRRLLKAIAEARDKGDLSENAEYDAAKNAQGMLELRINELEKVLANARLIDASQLDPTIVTLLSTVEIENIKTKKVFKYTLVSEAESDLTVRENIRKFTHRARTIRKKER
jgi:transcription elongation factor GreA